MNLRRHEILPCPGTCTSEFTLKTRVFSPFAPTATARFQRAKTPENRRCQPWSKSSMKFRNSVSLLGGLGGRRAPPGGRKRLETMKCRPRSSRVHHSIASSTLSTLPSFVAIRLALPSVLLASRARWPAKALATAAGLLGLDRGQHARARPLRRLAACAGRVLLGDGDDQHLPATVRQEAV